MTARRRRSDAIVLAVLGLALAIATSGCTQPPAPEPALAAPASEADLIGPWTDLSTGQQVPDVKPGDPLLVTVFASSNACSNDGITLILRVGWPLGTEVGPPYDVPSFLRETTGARLKTLGESDLDAEQPADPRLLGSQTEPAVRSVSTPRPAGPMWNVLADV